PFLAGFQLFLAHKPGNAVLATTFSLVSQRYRDAGAAVSATALLKDRFDFLNQRLILPDARASGFLLVRVETAGGDFQRVGQFLDLEVSFQSVHELEAL